MYAPKYCDNRLAPEENMLQKVIEVNRWIQKFNKENTGKSYELTATCVYFDLFTFLQKQG